MVSEVIDNMLNFVMVISPISHRSAFRLCGLVWLKAPIQVGVVPL